MEQEYRTKSSIKSDFDQDMDYKTEQREQILNAPFEDVCRAMIATYNILEGQ